MSTDPQTPQDGSADVPADVNRRGIWPLWHRNQEWRDKLSQKLAHKALDIPDDDMNITNTKVGIGTAGVIGIATAAGLPGVLLAGYLLFKDARPEPTAPQPSPEVSVPDTEYDVLFYDKDGNPIQVPHISTKPKQ